MRKIKFNAAIVVAFIVFLSGLLNIYSAFYALRPARMAIVEEFFPLEIRHASRTLILLSGFSLLFLSWGINKKKYRAWWISIILLSMSLMLHLVKGLDLEEDIALLLPLALLVIFRVEFNVRSATKSFAKRIAFAAVVLSMLFFYAIGGYFLLQGQFTKPVNFANVYHDYEYTITGAGQDTLIPATRRARWFEDSIATTGLVSLLSVLGALFAPQIFANKVSEEDLKRAKKTVLENGRHPISFLSLMPDKNYFFAKKFEGLVAYRVVANTALALGAPVAAPKCAAMLAQDFYQTMQLHGLSCAFYQITEEDKNLFIGMNLKFLKIGDDAIINTAGFDLSAPAFKTIRNSHSFIKRQEVNFAWYHMDELPWAAVRQIEVLHETWLSDKASQGMDFSMDFFPFPAEPEGEVLLAIGKEKNLLGAFSFFPFASNTGRSLDLMLKIKNSPNGLVEAALAEAINKFKAEKVSQVSLGLANKIEQQSGDTTPLAQRGLKLFYKFSQLFYKNYDSLAFFKAKFHPEWQPRYLAYGSDADLPKVALAVTQAHVKKKLFP